MVMFSPRTLFLVIRGVDQTGRAMRSASGGIRQLISDEKELARMSHRLLFAGAAFLSFGFMAGRALASIVGETERGSVLVGAFGEAWKRLKTSLVTSLIEQHGEELERWLFLLNQLTGKQHAIDVAVNWIFKLIKFSIFAGIGAGAIGIAGTLIAFLATALKTMGGGLLTLVGSGSLGTGNLAMGALGLGKGLGAAGGALMTIGVPIAIALITGKVMWHLFLTQEARDGLRRWVKNMRNWVTREYYKLRFGDDWYDKMTGHGALPTATTPSTIPNMQQYGNYKDTEINVNIEQILTQMDEEELNSSWVILADRIEYDLDEGG